MLARPQLRNGHSALYVCVSRLLSARAIESVDGSYLKLLESLAESVALVVDDCGLAPLSAENRHDPLEVLEDLHSVRSTVVTSQIPFDMRYYAVGDPTLADAILNCLVCNAYKLDLKGDSTRERGRLSTVDLNGELSFIIQSHAASLRQAID